MSSLNKVQIIGRLGKDPETRYSADGAAITSVSIATSQRWKDKASGDLKEETEWHRVVFFGRLAEVVGEHLKKGSQAYVEGRLKTRKWQDKDGQDRYTTEIVATELVMLGSAPGGGAGQPPDRARERPSSASPPKRKGAFDDFEDDVPF